MWRGLAASAVASAAAAALLASGLGSQPQECLSPTLEPTGMGSPRRAADTDLWGYLLTPAWRAEPPPSDAVPTHIIFTGQSGGP